jgi:hypothetical protein
MMLAWMKVHNWVSLLLTIPDEQRFPMESHPSRGLVCV